MTKNNKKPPASRKRTLSRLMAIQSLYQYNFYQGEENIDGIIENIVDNYTLDQNSPIESYREKIDVDFLQNLVLGILPIVDKIDAEISEFLQGDWTLDQLPEIMLITIRFACFELKFLTEIPPRVILSQYVDVAASFFDKKKVTFVNSVLDNLAKKYRSDFVSNNKI